MVLGRHGHGPNRNGYSGYVLRKSGEFTDSLRPDLDKTNRGTVTTIVGNQKNDIRGSNLGRSWRDRSHSSEESRSEHRDPAAGGIQKIVQFSTKEELELAESGGVYAVKNV